MLPDEIQVEKLQFRYGTKTEIRISENTIMMSASVRFYSGNVVYVDLTTDFMFFVEDLDSVVTYKEETSEISFEPDLLPTFLSVACGTMRGILYDKVKETSLGNYPIPLLGIDLLTKNNMISII